MHRRASGSGSCAPGWQGGWRHCQGAAIWQPACGAWQCEGWCLRMCVRGQCVKCARLLAGHVREQQHVALQPGCFHRGYTYPDSFLGLCAHEALSSHTRAQTGCVCDSMTSMSRFTTPLSCPTQLPPPAQGSIESVQGPTSSTRTTHKQHVHAYSLRSGQHAVRPHTTSPAAAIIPAKMQTKGPGFIP